MKKLLAIILSAICLFSCLSVSVSAENGTVFGSVFEGIVNDYLGIESEEEYYSYGIVYEMEAFSGVTLIYNPMATISFTQPGTFVITDDSPLAIDHELVCWRDSDYNKYYPGDSIHVDGRITLYAIWKEKEDNDPYVIRLIKTTTDAFVKMFKKFFKIFDIAYEFYPDYLEGVEILTEIKELELPVKYAVYEEGRIKVCIDSPSMSGIACMKPEGTVSVSVGGASTNYAYKLSPMTDGDGCEIILIDIALAEGETASFTLPEKLYEGTVLRNGYTSVDPTVYVKDFAQIQYTQAYEVSVTA